MALHTHEFSVRRIDTLQGRTRLPGHATPFTLSGKPKGTTSSMNVVDRLYSHRRPWGSYFDECGFTPLHPKRKPITIFSFSPPPKRTVDLSAPGNVFARLTQRPQLKRFSVTPAAPKKPDMAVWNRLWGRNQKSSEKSSKRSQPYTRKLTYEEMVASANHLSQPRQPHTAPHTQSPIVHQPVRASAPRADSSKINGKETVPPLLLSVIQAPVPSPPPSSKKKESEVGASVVGTVEERERLAQLNVKEWMAGLAATAANPAAKADSHRSQASHHSGSVSNRSKHLEFPGFSTEGTGSTTERLLHPEDDDSSLNG